MALLHLYLAIAGILAVSALPTIVENLFDAFGDSDWNRRGAWLWIGIIIIVCALWLPVVIALGIGFAVTEWRDRV